MSISICRYQYAIIIMSTSIIQYHCVDKVPDHFCKVFQCFLLLGCSRTAPPAQPAQASSQAQPAVSDGVLECIKYTEN